MVASDFILTTKLIIVTTNPSGLYIPWRLDSIISKNSFTSDLTGHEVTVSHWSFSSIQDIKDIQDIQDMVKQIW